MIELEGYAARSPDAPFLYKQIGDVQLHFSTKCQRLYAAMFPNDADRSRSVSVNCTPEEVAGIEPVLRAIVEALPVVAVGDAESPATVERALTELGYHNELPGLDYVTMLRVDGDLDYRGEGWLRGDRVRLIMSVGKKFIDNPRGPSVSAPATSGEAAWVEGLLRTKLFELIERLP